MSARQVAREKPVHAVTGPYSYTGRYIAARLHRTGATVRGLVRNRPHPDHRWIDCRTLQFDDARRLSADLDGVDVLYNTYWIRCPRDGMTFERAVENTCILATAAAAAGVRRIVHISVTNAASDSPFAYFRGKAAAEDAIRSTAVPVSIIRPTLVYGREDVLVNNIAWLLRTLRVFAVPGGGDYLVQPVFVGDVAGFALREANAQGNRVLDAAGPEVLSFLELVRAIARGLPIRAIVTRSPPAIAQLGAITLGHLLGDVLVTREELAALSAETLLSAQPATATTHVTGWLETHGHALGLAYTSETARHWLV